MQYGQKFDFNVLALDGGGMRGLVAATVLTDLEQQVGKQCYEIFRIIGGVSIGGILATGLASGVKADTLRSMFRDQADVIFDRNGKWFEYANSNTGLKKNLVRVLGTKTFADLYCELSVGSCIQFPDATEQAQPVQFQSINAADQSVSLVDACLATSAAPTYFPYHEFTYRGKVCSFVDGGLVTNNPSYTVSVMAASFIEHPHSDTFHLSIGCGAPTKSVFNYQVDDIKYVNFIYNPLGSSDNTGGAWNPRWAVHGLPFSINAQGRYIVDQMMREYRYGNYYRLDPEGIDSMPMDTTSEENLVKLEQAAQVIIASESYNNVIRILKYNLK